MGTPTDRGPADRILISTHEVCLLHDPGLYHPERASRLTAVCQGIEVSGVQDAVDFVEAPTVPTEALTAVHPASLLDRLEEMSRTGGGAIDADTGVSEGSAEAARRAAGAGLDLIDRLERGEGSVGWSVVRPPGHHATATRQMGFCLVNNVAVAARALASRGERVVVVDVDAHHGNGTQDIFYRDGNVLFISFHQWPWYPFSGAAGEIGEGDGRYATVNIPVPSGATGDVYRTGIEQVVAPVLATFEPTWMLVSLGFDGHRDDPLTELGLTSGDFGDIVFDLLQFVPAGRRLMFLEGGYDLRALKNSTAAVLSAVAGERARPEKATSGGPGDGAVEDARRIHVEHQLDG